MKVRIWSMVAVAIVTVLPSLVAAAAPPPSVDVYLPVALVGGGLPTLRGVDLDRELVKLSAPMTIVRTQYPSGAVDLTAWGGKDTVAYFGPGLAQLFAASASTGGFARAEVGGVRLDVHAAAVAEPLSYKAPFPGALGENQFQSYAGIIVNGSFWDVIVPPVTNGKPVGSPTSLTIQPRLNCSAVWNVGCPESCFPLSDHVDWTVSAALFKMDAQTNLGGGFTSRGSGGFVYDCPIGVDVTIDKLTVGTPVLLQYSASVSVSAIAGNGLSTGSGGYTRNVGRSDGGVDASHTGYVIVTDADGNPVVGESHVTYDGNPILEPITTTTTTTTSTTFVPPSTLPSCSQTAYCGDGTYQPECGESCDCPQPAPGQTATICAANVALPNLAQACALCVGCQIDASPCSTNTTTTTIHSTTTLPGATTTTTTIHSTTTLPGATTTTTVAGVPTTTTTLPVGPCAGHSGFDGVQCVCTGGIAPAECSVDRVPAAIGKLFTRGCARVQHAEGLSPKKMKKIVRGAGGTFAKDLARITKAATGKHPLSADCRAALAAVVGDAKQRTEQIGSGR